MIIVVATTAMVGLMQRHDDAEEDAAISLAPSTRAASRMSAGMPFSAAERITMQKPVHIQTSTTISAKLLMPRVDQPGLRLAAPERVRMALSRPVCGWPAGV